MTYPEPIQPEDLRPDQLSLIPEAPQERTATALLPLLAGVSELMNIPEAELSQLRGNVHDNGQVGLFAWLAAPGSADVSAYIVGWGKTGKPGWTAVEYDLESDAAELYGSVWEKITAGE